MLWMIAVLGAVAFGLSAVGCGVVRRWSVGRGWVDAAGSEAHKPARADGAVPNTGGVGVFWAIGGPLALVCLAVGLIPGGGDGAGWLPAEWYGHLPGLRGSLHVGLGLLGGLAVLHVLGLVDDRRALGAGPKLMVQAAAAALMVVVGDCRVLTLLTDVGPVGYAAMLLISVAWFVVVINAMNFMDNLDGLSGGVGVITAGIYLAATILAGQWFVAGLSALLLGALAGFLVYNLPPARLYLGDSGSLVVGLMLATIAVRTTYVHIPPPAEAGSAVAVDSAVGGWYGLLMPVLVLAVPLYDFASVTLIRLLRGQSPFKGDHNHFSHRLLRRGLTQWGTLTVIYLATAATGLGGVMLGHLTGWQSALVLAQAVCVLSMIAVLERGGRRSADARP